MPISFKLTKKEVLILQLIKRLDSFKQLRINNQKSDILSQKFSNDVEIIHNLSKYNKRLSLDIIAFSFDNPDTEVPQKYVTDETDEINDFKTPRGIPKQTFIDFRAGCGADEYMLFGFHKNKNTVFYLGYVKQNCNDNDIKCTIRFFVGEDNDTNNHVKDGKGKKAILHTKEEFDALLKNTPDIGGKIYLYKRKYRVASSKSEQTIVLSNDSTIAKSSSFDNVGGSCCPPMF